MYVFGIAALLGLGAFALAIEGRQFSPAADTGSIRLPAFDDTGWRDVRARYSHTRAGRRITGQSGHARGCTHWPWTSPLHRDGTPSSQHGQRQKGAAHEAEVACSRLAQEGVTACRTTRSSMGFGSNPSSGTQPLSEHSDRFCPVIYPPAASCGVEDGSTW
jgi:hypothetical protein